MHMPIQGNLLSSLRHFRLLDVVVTAHATRHFSSRLISTKRLIYRERGDPNKVLEQVTEELPTPTTQEGSRSPVTKGASSTAMALVRWLAAPINPADINQVQGVYGVQPPLPATGGNEGCGIVEQLFHESTESQASSAPIKVGQRVIPASSGLGTWSTHGVYPIDELYPIDERLPLEVAATLQVNPSTAYRMLSDFVDPAAVERSGQGPVVVIQNGATSSVGRYVIQIASLLGYKTINLVRDRPDLEDVRVELKRLGADEVLTEEEYIRVVKQSSAGNSLPKAHLALNCVSGRSGLVLCRALVDGGQLVSYGAMSRQPLQVATGSLIFNDIVCRGYWMSKWYERERGQSARRDEMYRKLSEWFLSGKLTHAPVQKRSIDDFKEAIAAATGTNGKTERKQLLFF